MGWTYDEYLDQPEWFVVALARQFKEQDKQDQLLLQGFSPHKGRK